MSTLVTGAVSIGSRNGTGMAAVERVGLVNVAGL